MLRIIPEKISQLLNRLPASARFMLLSSLGFALMSACVKAVGNTGLPLMEIVAARALISLVISYVDIRRKRLPLLGYNKPFLALRGVFGTFGLMAVFYSVTTMPIAQATLLQYSHPAFTAVLALFFLKERIQLSTVFCIILSFIGVLVMTLPNLLTSVTAQVSGLSLSAAIAGACFSACAYVVVRKLSQTEDPSVIIIYFPMIAFPVAMTILIAQGSFVMPTLYQFCLLILIGVFVQVGQWALTHAMATDNAGKVSAYGYVQILFAAVIGIVIFSEIPTIWTLAGGLLIIAGAFVNSAR